MLRVAFIAKFEANPTPAVRYNSEGDDIEFLKEGVEGFCCIRLARDHPFAKWMLRKRYASRTPSRQVEIHVRAASGSLQRAEARTKAMLRMLWFAMVPVEGVAGCWLG